MENAGDFSDIPEADRKRLETFATRAGIIEN